MINAYATYEYFLTVDDPQELNSLVKLYELIIFIRMLKLLTLLYEIKTMRIIIETMRNLILPLFYLTGVLTTIYYVFALMGMFMFGGKIRKGLREVDENPSIPDNYYLDNFNDLLSSFVTLFTLMVVNNWMV